MLEVLAGMALQGTAERSEEIAFIMLKILAGSSEICSTLYCYRTLAALCKADPKIGKKLSNEIFVQLKSSLGYMLGDQTNNMSSIRESAVLYTGYLIVILSH